MSTSAEPAAAEPASTPAAAPEAPTQLESGRFGPPPGAPVAEFDPVHPRVLTESTRSLFAAMGKAAAAKAEAAKAEPDAAPDDPYDHDDEPTPQPAATPAPAAAATPATPVPAVAAPVPAPAVPAPDHRAALALEAREKVIADREAAFAAREKALEDSRRAIVDEAIADYEIAQAAKYLEGGTEALTEMIKKWTGISDDEVSEEWQGLIGEGSGKYLKLQVEPEVANKLSQRRIIHKVTAGQLATKRELERLRSQAAARDAAEQARRDAETKQLEEARAVERAKADEAQAHAGLTAILQSQDKAGKAYREHFPHLTSEPDPAALVIEAAKQLSAHQPGKPFTWEEAAGLAESTVRKANQSFYEHRKHLFTPTPATPAASTPAAAPQSAPTQGRGARATTTLTNGAAPAAPATPSQPAEPADTALDMDAVRRRSFARVREAMAKRDQAGA